MTIRIKKISLIKINQQISHSMSIFKDNGMKLNQIVLIQIQIYNLNRRLKHILKKFKRIYKNDKLQD